MRFAAAALLAFLLAAAQARAGPKTASEDPTSMAKKFVDRLAAGDFATAVKGFDPAMTAALPADKLAEVWKTLNAQAGAFQKQTGARSETQGKYQVIFVRCKFEKAELEAKIVFDTSKRIAGLFFVPPPSASSEYRPPDYERPGSYRDTEVRVGRGEWALPGTLSSPRSSLAAPGLVLVHGSGPLDRDQTLGPNRPFRDLAAGLASRGVAVLRYDKRTRVHAARLAREPDGLTLREETIVDAVEAVRLLRRTRGVDGSRVFVLGHSLGGVALPRIAALEAGIAGFVMLATPSRPLMENLLEQMTYLSRLDGVVSNDEKDRLESIRRQVERMGGERSAGGPSDDLPLGLSRAYWEDLARHDPREAAAALTGPVLVMQGGRDYQVTRQDFDGWRRIMETRSDVAFKLYPSLNHLFMAGTGKSTPDEYQIAGHVASEVVEDLAAWLKAPTAGAPPASGPLRQEQTGEEAGPQHAVDLDRFARDAGQEIGQGGVPSEPQRHPVGQAGTLQKSLQQAIKPQAIAKHLAP